MSLRFDVSKVADHENLCWTKDQWGHEVAALVTQALAMFSVRIGMNQITPANAEEFAERVAAVEAQDGVFITDFDEETGWFPRPITVEDVRAHIGLHTNASGMTKTQFRKSLTKAA